MLCTLSFRLPAGYDSVGRSIFKIEKTAGVDPAASELLFLLEGGFPHSRVPDLQKPNTIRLLSAVMKLERGKPPSRCLLLAFGL